MNHNEKTQWENMFGTAWETLIGVKDDVGAFAAFKNTGNVLLDKNARELLGIKDEPPCSEFLSILDKVNSLSGRETGIEVRFVKNDDDAAAGFVLSISSDELFDDELMPLYPKTYLIKKLNEAEQPSMLAVIKLEGFDSSAAANSCFVLTALNTIISELPENAVISSQSRTQFWIFVPNLCGEPQQLLCDLQTAIKNSPLCDESGQLISSSHSMTFSAGIGASEGSASHRMFTAGFALFDADAKGTGSVCRYSDSRYETKKNEYNSIRLFSKLVDENLFKYHFQPIVSAKTGEIIAYEALMRTDASIGLNPLQILDLAGRFNRLYDIEKATMRNTLDFLSANQEHFEKRKLFVNVISSQILADSDFKSLCSDFGELLEKVVIELTEQTEISDESLAAIHSRIKNQKMELAIDDYGTGYSNTSNLIRYNPAYVKIDRSLITEIQSDFKKKKIVSNIIEFLHASGYIALGEGVETAEELQTLIHMGIDLVQGYYISRPKPVLLHEVTDALRSEIIRYNLEKNGEIQKIYRCDKDCTVDLCKLAVEKYTDIFVGNAKVTVNGQKGQSARIAISIKENAAAEMTINNLELDSAKNAVLISLGKNSSLKLICKGSNHINKGCIFVPDTASIHITGGGNLTISTSNQNCYAIGNAPGLAYGNIKIDLSGKLSINCDGENCAVIGGGKNPGGSVIHIGGGDVSISSSGGLCVGIGSISGSSIVNINDCSLSFKFSASKAVAVGAAENSTEISLKNFRFVHEASGNMLAGMGILGAGVANISALHGSLKTSMNGRTLLSVGTVGGVCNYYSEYVGFDFYAEGASALGIGDAEGGGKVELNHCEVKMRFLTSNGRALGSPNGTLTENDVVKTITINE